MLSKKEVVMMAVGKDATMSKLLVPVCQTLQSLEIFLR